MSVLLPPGMGDQHWIMLKMQSMVHKLFGGRWPQFWVWQPRMAKMRTKGYLDRLPFGEFKGFWDDQRYRKVYLDLYARGRWVVKQRFQGFDYVIGFNRPLELGTRLQEILPGCMVNWNYPIEQTEHERELCEGLATADPYILTFFCGHGFYSKWTSALNINRFLFDLHSHFPEYRIVLTGREWDEGFNARLAHRDWIVNMVGQTSLDHLFALIRNAAAFIGFAAGNGMIAQHLRTPTMMFWHEHFHPAFWTNWVDPARMQTVYRPVNVASFKFDEEMEWLRSSIRSR